MEPEELEELLLKTARLTEENNKILRRMQRAERFAMIARILRLVVVVGVLIALYFLIQPHLAEIQALIGEYRGALEPEGVQRNELIENFLREQNILGEDPTVGETAPAGQTPEPERAVEERATPQPR